jgi:hypothetical protein
VIEIIVGIYLTSFCLSWCLIGLGLLKLRRQERSSGRQFLNRNLRLIDLYWSNTRNEFVPWTDTAEAEDRARSFRQLLFIAGGLSFLSAFGLLMNIILMLSIFVIARTRMEKRLFASPLAHEELTHERVAALVAELRG